MGIHSSSRLIALPANIRLGWNIILEANTLSYYATAVIAFLKGLIVQASGQGQFIAGDE
jgi:hypothetical protein